MNMVAWAIIKLWAKKWGKQDATMMLLNHAKENAEMMTNEEIAEIIALVKKLETFEMD